MMRYDDDRGRHIPPKPLHDLFTGKFTLRVLIIEEKRKPQLQT